MQKLMTAMAVIIVMAYTAETKVITYGKTDNGMFTLYEECQTVERLGSWKNQDNTKMFTYMVDEAISDGTRTSTLYKRTETTKKLGSWPKPDGLSDSDATALVNGEKGDVKVEDTAIEGTSSYWFPMMVEVRKQKIITFNKEGGFKARSLPDETSYSLAWMMSIATLTLLLFAFAFAERNEKITQSFYISAWSATILSFVPAMFCRFFVARTSHDSFYYVAGFATIFTFFGCLRIVYSVAKKFADHTKCGSNEIAVVFIYLLSIAILSLGMTIKFAEFVLFTSIISYFFARFPWTTRRI